ncbi:MAG: adenylyltransferase/cytidyltransferase family protein [Bacteroidales bacterium]|jgi:D-glycero-beta-D-manno-heptose 1-phosphate adenylyltransferase|nr:D-glycero-beta-D-manno-heptose 1-phosphate adenylyltransferase [Lentimicrobiaceae bacterium]MDG1136322.1 adenylyltransferase/cytidyltransferase family protein [Bacteroidales bacterium]MDG1902399.1 adenylyltransferase/cytidyltransferase family protein [Bacteroidales bacterium]MDG2081897.1 adenylyltransferase/cytidyltransferase family protein [Bacteroidales bacterium]|tara:strand:- start:1707 stop:2201 length:495 start_codon:yes stop_codon:yes gene_type:complete
MNKLDEIRDKVLSNSQLRSKIYEWTELNKSIVFTNGVFDIVHLGHIDYLSKAKDEGDILLVGVNSDDSARKLGKGSSRPINNEISRSTIIAALQFVDAVILFSEDTPYNLIKLVQPDILVKGSDYMPENIVGYDIVMQKGGSIKTIDFLEGYSTTLIEKKIKYS